MQLMTLHTIFGNCSLSVTRPTLMFSAILGFASRVSETTRNGSNQESAGSSSARVRAGNAKAQGEIGPAGCKVTLKRFNVMRAIVVMVAVLLVGALRPELAHAWASANRWGGSTTHSWGATSHTNAWGGSTSHAYGVGTEHTNMYGGSSAHAWGGGTEHTNVYGGSTYGSGTGQERPIPMPPGRRLITRLATVDTGIPPITRLVTDTAIPPITRRSRYRIIRRRDVMAALWLRERLSVPPWGRWPRPPTRRQPTRPATPLAARRDMPWV